jgi:Arc/MetJ family transcription regulator
MPEGETMRTTLALDDELVAEAQEFTGLTEKSALVREALRALIQREPDLQSVPRRRSAV